MIDTIISIFKDVKSPQSPHQITVEKFLNRIKNGSPATENVKRFRESSNDVFKFALPCVTFSGTFSYRKKEGLLKFSQFACLDFDKFAGLEDAQQIKDNLCTDECLFCCFISPSGKGVKAVFRVANSPEKYESMYRALCLKYTDVHLDSKTKDISRLCFESYDPEIYINPNAKEWTQCEEDDYQNLGSNRYDVSVPLKSENRIIDLLQVWFDKKYSLGKGNRNDSIYRFAAALNAYGVNEFTAINYLLRFEEGGFSKKEIETSVKSAYKRLKSEFNTKAFEDKETRYVLQKAISSGKSVKEIKRELEKTNNPIATDTELFVEILETVKTSENVDVFWEINDKGKIKLIPHKFDLYLKSNNFMKFYPESSSDTFIFVQKDKSLIEFTNRDKIKDFVLADLKNRDNIGLSPFDFMALNTKYFSNEFLNMLEAVDIEIKKDTAEKCFLYYRNCVVEIGLNYHTTIDYIDVDKFVWKDSVIDRDFRNFDHHGGEFRSFIWYIAGQNKDSYDCFKSAIGYLLHSYKTNANNKAIILNDEMISDEPNGRSGKGVFFNGIKQLKKLVSLNGKKIDLSSQFAFQTVKADCQVLVFDDVKRNFPFEDLFSIITEGLEIEYKGQGAIKLPVTKSPKIVITTNYTIKGKGGSFDARKHELELSSYFNSNYSPRDLFGHMLFDDWTDDEWCRFDNFMIQCVQYYLKNGLQLQKHKNLELRKYISETCQDFHDWTNEGGNLALDTRHFNNDIFNKFLTEYPDYRNNLKIKTFKRWVKLYASKHGYKYYDSASMGMRYFYLSEKGKEKIQEIEEMPF
jgi:hypothetical protein